MLTLFWAFPRKRTIWTFPQEPEGRINIKNQERAASLALDCSDLEKGTQKTDMHHTQSRNPDTWASIQVLVANTASTLIR